MARTRLPSREQDGHCPTKGAFWLTAAGWAVWRAGGLAEQQNSQLLLPGCQAARQGPTRDCIRLVIVCKLSILSDRQVFWLIFTSTRLGPWGMILCLSSYRQALSSAIDHPPLTESLLVPVTTQFY